MTVTDKAPALEGCWKDLEAHLSHFLPKEQAAAVALYRELATGQPVDAAQLGQALRISSVESHALLQRDSISRFIYPDDQGRVLGFADSLPRQCVSRRISPPVAAKVKSQEDVSLTWSGSIIVGSRSVPY